MRSTSRIGGVAAVGSLALGVGPAAFIAALWIALTAATGKTYHLAPPLVAAAPGAVIRLRAPAPASAPAVVASGLMTVAVGWLAIVVLQIEPPATVIAGQPGGVIAEVIVGALAGALLAGTAGGPRPPGRSGAS